MKHLKLFLILAFALPAAAQQRISERTTLAGASIDTAADWFPIVDTSAGTSGDKKTSLVEMWKALGGTNVSSTELGYLDGVTSAVQTQLDAKLDLSSLSTTGGANKVMKANTDGDWQTGAYSNSGSLGTGGNILIPQFRGLSFRDADGVQGALMYLWPNHTGSYDELIRDVQGSLCDYWTTGYQLGNATGGNHYIYLHSGSASSGTTMRQSVPVGLNTATWTGGASVLNRMAIQAAPLDLTGTNSAVQIFQNTSLGSAQAVSGTKIAEIAAAGVWSAGTAPTFESLTDGSTITQTCSKYRTVQAAKVTITDNRTLAISGAEAGMRGVIYVSQDAIGSRTLALPSGSATASGWALSTTALAVDRLQWEYDGTYFYWTIDKGITLPSDSDATAFISTTGATDTAAINTFVVGLKSMGLWSTSVCWPMRSTQNYGSGTTLKSLGGLGTFDGTLTNGPTWGTDGITFDGTNDYIALSNPSQSTALASFSMFSVFDSDQSASKLVFGAFNSSTTQIGPSIWAGGTPLSGSDPTRLLAYCSLDGTNTNESHGSVTAGNTGSFQTAFFAANSSEMLVYANTTSGSVSGTRATYWNNETTWAMGRRGNASAYFTGPQAFHFFSTTKLTAAQHTALRDLYKATLGSGLSLP